MKILTETDGSIEFDLIRNETNLNKHINQDIALLELARLSLFEAGMEMLCCDDLITRIDLAIENLDQLACTPNFHYFGKVKYLYSLLHRNQKELLSEVLSVLNVFCLINGNETIKQILTLQHAVELNVDIDSKTIIPDEIEEKLKELR